MKQKYTNIKTPGKNTNVLTVIKRRASIRRYQNKPIPKKILNQIIDAGRWGPSINLAQPWKFIILTDKSIITAFTYMIIERLKAENTPGLVSYSSAGCMFEAPAVILIYYDSSLAERAKTLKDSHLEIAKLAEMKAISAAVQNMILAAEYLGIGTCWLDALLIAEKEINASLHLNNEKLFSALSLGYPAVKGNRSPRRFTSDIIKYL